ncbi:hypothetical protein FQA39_LY13683 [Lamprigera yunnana]|nr:hypothetical protein FQA39_LY13683 [Lamprigera yunnana]
MKVTNEEKVLAYCQQKFKAYKILTNIILKIKFSYKEVFKFNSFPKTKVSGNYSKTYSVFTKSEKSEIITFLREADDRISLMMKVVLVVGIIGARRGEELIFLKVQTIKEMRSIILIKISNKNTNVRRQTSTALEEYIENLVGH